MAQYLVAIHRPHTYDPSTEDEVMRRAIDEVNDQMKAAGIRVFVGGLQPTDRAHSLRLQEDGNIIQAPGPHLHASEYVGGFWVLEAATNDEALEWGRKAARACRASVEVRPFY